VRDFLWRYWYAGNRSRLVLALIALAILVVLLLVRRLRVFHVLVPSVIGGIVVVGWLLVSPLASLAPTPVLIIPERPLVKNGIPVTADCGTERDSIEVLDHLPNRSMSTWGTEPKGTCVVRYHHPPDPAGSVQ
jgi:hypothetical protein